MNDTELAYWQAICQRHYDKYVQSTHGIQNIDRDIFYDKRVMYEGAYWKLYKIYRIHSNDMVLKDIQKMAIVLNQNVIAIPISRFWNYMVWVQK